MTRVFVAILSLLAGCAPSTLNVNRAAPALSPEPSVYDDAASTGIGRIGILEPNILLYDVSAGGIFEYRDDWSKSASENVMISAALRLIDMDYEPVILPDIVGARSFFRLKNQIRYHGDAFQSDMFKPMDLVEGLDTLTYSVGPLDELCAAFRVDGFLYIYGFEENFSKERREVVGQESAERTSMVAMLIERSGRLLWYRHVTITGNLDMREKRHALRMTGALFK